MDYKKTCDFQAVGGDISETVYMIERHS